MASATRIQLAARLLVAERQAMYARAAGQDELESNRLELVRRQQDLAHALVARCLRRPDNDAG